MLFLGIISWKGTSRFNVSVCFLDGGGFIFKFFKWGGGASISRFVKTFLTILEISSFRLVLEGKTGKLIPESLRLEFLDKFFANNFALSNAEDSTYWPLNRGGITDLPLLRALLAIRHASRHPSFWEVMISFVLVAYASLAASRTFLQWPLACLNFPLDS